MTWSMATASMFLSESEAGVPQVSDHLKTPVSIWYCYVPLPTLVAS